MLNVARMRMLREVGARGSIAAAAEALYMTPSAVSQQMSLLERESGVELLDRSRRRARLTAAGDRLVEHTERVLAVLEEAQADLADASGGLAGRIAVCASHRGACDLVLAMPPCARARALSSGSATSSRRSASPLSRSARWTWC